MYMHVSIICRLSLLILYILYFFSVFICLPFPVCSYYVHIALLFLIYVQC
jgi:hypothetical protein